MQAGRSEGSALSLGDEQDVGGQEGDGRAGRG